MPNCSQIWINQARNFAKRQKVQKQYVSIDPPHFMGRDINITQTINNMVCFDIDMIISFKHKWNDTKNMTDMYTTISNYNYLTSLL